ncbi:MAG: RsmB/NOP family class I SAM-dependent RNA methyltransferase [Rhodobacteraceae bacterium]|nr:RsmB/NOP family class I SAM-dependent RNA methyltransferase [Paracoccaceae bacterium]
MTPGARYQAAIEVLDAVASGMPAEQALTRWARKSRFAGSRDRAAVRDHVFDVVRCRRTCAALGGGHSGRALVLGMLRDAGIDPATVFDGQGYGPSSLTSDEETFDPELAPNDSWDLPDWLCDRLQASHGAAAREIARALRSRAPVFIRANLAKAARSEVATLLHQEGIETTEHHMSKSALRVVEGARRISGSTAFTKGLIELQDAASQAVSDLVPLAENIKVLDYCAGGGGKSLALAARRPSIKITAHDFDPRRMTDLPARARRAGAEISVQTKVHGAFDVVLCDVPCSGSGAWRRSPEGKWVLSPQRLSDLCRTQAEILDTCAQRCRPQGHLVYVTCSMLNEENADQIAAFTARHDGWRCQMSRQFLPQDGGDGFFIALLVSS